MAYTTPTNTTISYAELISQTDIQQWVDDLVWVGSLLRNTVAISGLANGAELMPAWGARAYNSSNILHTNTGGWQNMTFDTETYDTDTIHSTSVNTGRFTAQRAGIYLASGALSWASNATGSRGIRIQLNGTTWSEHYTVAGSITVTVATLVKMAVNEYVTFDGFQSSGGNLNMNTNGNFGIMGSIQWVGVSA